nr:MAG TPA: hypothetical protein [Caudoviricetes sp.]
MQLTCDLFTTILRPNSFKTASLTRSGFYYSFISFLRRILLWQRICFTVFF